MNITPEMMYWLTRCDNIRTASVILAAVFVLLFIYTLIPIIIDEKGAKSCFVICPVALIIVMTFAATFVFVPTTKEMAAIYVVPKIANSETVKDLGEGVVTLAREWIEELRPTKKEGGDK